MLQYSDFINNKVKVFFHKNTYSFLSNVSQQVLHNKNDQQVK